MKENNEQMVPPVTGRMVQEYSDRLMDLPLNEGTNPANPYNIPGFKQTTNFRPKYAKDQQKKKGKSSIAKFFSNMSRLGMNYDDQVIANMRAIPADKNMLPKESTTGPQDVFSLMQSAWKNKDNKDKDFFEKDFNLKREALRKLAMQPELEDILDTMTNEAIVYDSNYTYFMEPFIEERDLADFDKKIQKQIRHSVNNSFKRFYKMLGWRTKAWDEFKRFLIEGILSFEIVYDSLEKPTNIIGIIPLDPVTLTKEFKNNKWYWIQFKGVQGKERRLLDAQVIYIQYQETESISRVSYLERLIRPFNIYRIIEQAQLIWTVTNASYKMKFTIPVKGMPKTLGAQSLGSLMNRYKEDIKFIGDTGELTVNGRVNMPFNKEYWLPETESGTPEIETIGGDGPELVDNDQLKFYKNNMYRISKIPLNRFDQENGETWFGTDASSYARTEMDFARFVHRLRNIFAQIMIKPLTLQLTLEVPALAENREFLEAISVHFKSNNLFEELMEMELMQKRVDFIQAMKDGLVDQDKEANEIKFFSSKFLVTKYLHLSDSDIELNDTMKQQEIEDLNLAGNESNDEMDMESLGEDELDKLIMEANEVKKRLRNKKKSEKEAAKKSEAKPTKMMTDMDTDNDEE